MLDCEQYLTHATVHTCLQTYLLCTCSLSPSLSFLPCIHVAQRLPKDQWSDIEEEDSLELCAIPKDKCKGKCKHTPFPYCLKCSDKELDHAEGDCLLWKYCRWCFHVDHTDDNCPTSHLQYVKDTCVVPEWHPMVGNACPVAFKDDLYKLRCAAWDYDDEEQCDYSSRWTFPALHKAQNLFMQLLPQNTIKSLQTKCIMIAFESRINLVH